MFALLSRHFEGVTREQFERDLAEKNWVMEIRRNGRLAGLLHAAASARQQFDGSALTAIYSGDTIVAPEGWGSPALARTWIACGERICARTARRAAATGCSSRRGFRTYRFLPVFWREFFPRFDARRRPRVSGSSIISPPRSYGSRYAAASGLVRFPRPQRLRGALQAVPQGRIADPHVAFFLARNPGHAAGDELACLTEISAANLTPAGRRMAAAPPP